MRTGKVSTVGELRTSGWTSRSVRDEMRDNLVASLARGTSEEERWPGILGYGTSVIPQIENALLSRHDFILLGLRGQAKTRVLRMLVRLLDEEIPALAGCDLNDDPYAPISGRGRRLVAELGDDAPIRWIPRKERYCEKLATPDVTIADLLGDIDPIKAASRRVTLDDEDALLFGLVPRTNRGIFAINELPDLSPRIQVGLLNVLEERDVQLRGQPVRLPLDLLVVFSANPEDYTNRGSIITPLRDRIASQILTHYPEDLATARRITDQEAFAERNGIRVRIPEFLRDAIEETAFQARDSEFVDQTSGVSVRLTVALLENVISNAERRALRARHVDVTARVADLFAAHSAVTGKLELVFEGEREGPASIAQRILGQGVSTVFRRHFPAPYETSKSRRTPKPDIPPVGGPEDGAEDVYKPIVDWFAAGNAVVVQDETESGDELLRIPTLADLVRSHLDIEDRDLAAGCELVLEGLHQASLLAKDKAPGGIAYGDMLTRMFAGFED